MSYYTWWLMIFQEEIFPFWKLVYSAYINKKRTHYFQGGKLWKIRRKVKRPQKVKIPVQKTVNKFISSFDAQGSYTGVDAYDKYEKPVQDADDL